MRRYTDTALRNRILMGIAPALILAMFVLSSCSLDSSLAELKQKAMEGDAGAQFRVGLMHSTGEGMIQDQAEAARWYRAAAEQGHALAQNNLAAAYATGEGVDQDQTEAVRRYRVAAERGYDLAQYNLGAMYFTGDGVAQDFAKAAHWYRLAAEQGNALAQNNLGAMYDTGEGVAEDHIQAHKWYSLSAASLRGELGESIASNRDVVAKRMTPEQIAEAQRLVREWKPKSD